MGAPDHTKRSGAWLLAGILIGAGLMLAGVEVYHHAEAHSEGAAAPVPEPRQMPQHHLHSSQRKVSVEAKKQVSPRHVAHRNLPKSKIRSAKPAVKKQSKKLQPKPSPRHSASHVATKSSKFVPQGKTPKQILDWAEQSAPTDEARRVVAQARAAVASMQDATVSASKKVQSTAVGNVTPLHDEDDTPAAFLLSSSPSPMTHSSVPKMLSRKQEEQMTPNQILHWAAKHAKSAAAIKAVQNAQAVLTKMHQRAAAIPNKQTADTVKASKQKEMGLIDASSTTAKVVQLGDADGDEEEEGPVIDTKAANNEADALAKEESDAIVEQMFQEDMPEKLDKQAPEAATEQ